MPRSKGPLMRAMLAFLTVSFASGQPVTYATSDLLRKEYERFLDELLPKPALASPRAFVVAIRFLPSFHPEEQIAFCVDTNGKGELYHDALAVPLYRTLEDWERKRLPDTQSLAKLTNLHHTHVGIDSERAAQWLRDLSRSIASSLEANEEKTLAAIHTGETTVLLDGTKYQILIETGDHRINADFFGSEIDEKLNANELEVIKWMNTVRHEVLQLTKRPSG